jgi:2-oxoglutarate ferredoxin oxidoreductase subunit alpha
VRPGTPGMEHRIGGLEKDAVTGDLSGDPRNHQHMVELRAAKVAGIANDLPPLQIHGSPSGDLLVVSWGSTWGAVAQAVERAVVEGRTVGHVHLRHLNPFPPDLGTVLPQFRQVLVPELNTGQLALLLRARYLVDVVPLDKVQGRPFKVSEIHDRIRELTS